MGELEKIFKDEIKFFEENKKDLEALYGRNTYIVIRKDRVIDSGENPFELSKIYRNSFIMSIENSERVIEIPSPEIIK